MNADTEAGRWPDKDPESKEEFGVDFTQRLTRWRQERADYALTKRVRVRGRAGFEFECTTAGQTAIREPVFPSTVGATVADGSVTWTCRAASTASLLSTVSSVTWTAESPLTVSGTTLTGQVASALIDGGLDGMDYSVLVKATCADGQVIAKRCILPVRKAVAP
jgi:hypothetical protein